MFRKSSYLFGAKALCIGICLAGPFPLQARAATFMPAEGSTLLLGSGFNSVSGAELANCVEVDRIVPIMQAATSADLGQSVEFSLTQVTSAKDLRASLNIEAKASAFTPNVSGDLTAAYYQSHRFTNNNLYIVLKVKITNTSERLADLRLTPFALDLLRNEGPERFLATCGDSFVAGRTTGGEFTALIRIDTKSEENKKELQSKISAYSLNWSASGSLTATLNEISKTNNIDIKLFKRGGIGQLPDHTDIEGVFDFAREFPEKVQNNAHPTIYLLSTMNYHAVSNLPRPTISLSLQKGAMERIATLYDLALERWGTTNYVLEHEDQYEPFGKDVVTNLRENLEIIKQTIEDAALACGADPINCIAPRVDWPISNLPKKLVPPRPRVAPREIGFFGFTGSMISTDAMLTGIAVDTVVGTTCTLQ